MKKLKYLISFLLLFMVIGFAVVATSLSIRGTTTVANTLDDFKVYFSDVKVNGIQDLSLVKENTRIYFDILLEEIGDSYIIEYDVTNGSKYYDADISMTCTTGNEYLSVVNNFNTNDNLISNETRNGTLTLSKIKSIISDKVTDNVVVCELTATPVERTSIGSGTAADTVNLFYIGREIAIGEEKFNIISEQEDSITMLAKYNIDKNLIRQTQNQVWTIFSAVDGWEYTPGPNEIDIQTYGGDSKVLLNNYVDVIRNIVDDDTLTGDLITLSELKDLGCHVTDNYEFATTDVTNCYSSPYVSWLLNDQYWWTRSSTSSYATRIWRVFPGGDLVYIEHTYSGGVRPTITISKDLARRLISYKNYDIGDVITIGTERFNVIEDNAMTVTMLAQYNLGTDYRQSTILNTVSFTTITPTWEYMPGPKDIDLQTFGGDVKTYVNEYVLYLEDAIGYSGILGDLITLNQLRELGCTVTQDYSFHEDNTCLNSPYVSWLLNEQNFWTRSAYPDDGDRLVWAFLQTGGFKDYYASYGSLNGVRPVITISKDTLINYN